MCTPSRARTDPRRAPAAIRKALLLALLAGGLLLGWRYLSGPGGTSEPDVSWLHRHGPSDPPAADEAAPRLPPRRGPLMPRFTLVDTDGEPTPLWEGTAPAVVTEFLADCPDCEVHARRFPLLAKRVVAAGEQVVNVAYRGHPRRVAAYLEGRNFGGPVLLDTEGRMQRHFGIGTFTVWLLDHDGTIRFQGSPEEAERRLDEHLTRRGFEAVSRSRPPPG